MRDGGESRHGVWLRQRALLQPLPPAGMATLRAALALAALALAAASEPPVSKPPPAKPVPNHCDSLPAHPCIPLWPGIAPNETDVPKTPPETRTPDDGQGCGPARDIPCDHIHDVRPPPPSQPRRQRGQDSSGTAGR